MVRSKRLPAVDALVRELYGSLGEESRLEHALHRLGAAFRSHISGLHSEDFGAHRGRLTLVGDVTSDEYNRVVEDYSTRWTGQNLWMQRSVAGFRTQGFEHGDAVVSDAELRASAYYRHFLKPLDIRRGIGICLWNDSSLNMAVASFHRGHGDVGYDRDDIALVKELRPHLANAYAIYRRFAKLQGEHASIRAAFERAPLGMLVLDGDGRVLDCNAGADRMLDAGCGVTRGIDGRLLFASSLSRQAMAAAVARIAAHPSALPESIPVHRDAAGGNGPVLVLHLCGYPSAMGGSLPVGGRMLAFLAPVHPAQREGFETQVLQRTLGLTRAEARTVLALRRHPEVELAAQSLGIAPGTVRSHLKSVYRKLGVHHSGSLLLIVERLVSSAP